jgi:hypothetical protein
MTELPVEIRKLCPELLQDFLLFFDGEAFADNPKWGFCWPKHRLMHKTTTAR